MRMTVTLDDEVLESAQELTGVQETSELIRLALTRLVEREAARRLAAFGGSEPNLEYIPRRQPEPASA